MIFGTRSARRSGGKVFASPCQRCAATCEPLFADLSTANREGSRIGMPDHNAIRHRDPPLPDRLDPFYPQATIAKWVSLADPKKIRRCYDHGGEKIRFH